MGRLISKMLALAIVIGGIAVVSVTCAETDNLDANDSSANLYPQTTMEDQYISVESNGQRKLHKGDITFFETGYGKYSTGVNLTEMHFDCGKKMVSNAQFSLSTEMPSEDEYDDICTDCFD